MEVRHSQQEIRRRWAHADSGDRYRTSRFSSRGRAGRDVRAVSALLRRHGAKARNALDAPCGSGRLFEAIQGAAPGSVTGCDASRPMLDASRTHPWQALVEGDLLALPFADRSFDVVVCCRLLHHLDDRAHELVLGELSRVTRRLLIVSYWSGSSWPGWRRRLRLGRLDPAGRRERSDAELTAALTRRGFAIRELHRPVGRLSNQAFLVGARD